MSLDVSDWRCAVCLEELHVQARGPEVRACGVLLVRAPAMDHHLGASACPTCRRPFEHLPDVCVPLHRFLARAFPVEYARRLRETHEEEETKECFSPSPALDLDLGALRLTDKKDHDDDDDDDAKNASPLAFFDALERAPAVRGADDPVLERVFLCGFSDDRTDGPDSEHAQKHARRRHAARDPVVLTAATRRARRALRRVWTFATIAMRPRAPEAPEEPAGTRRDGDRAETGAPSATRASSETRRPRCASRCAQKKKRAFAGERRGDGEDAGVPVACSDPPTRARREPLA